MIGMEIVPPNRTSARNVDKENSRGKPENIFVHI